MSALCAAEGPWAQMNEAWATQQKNQWTDTLWKFQALPNAPPPSSAVDFGKILNVLLGLGLKAATSGVLLRAPLPAGLPPC
jgi:hypothetical protein